MKKEELCKLCDRILQQKHQVNFANDETVEEWLADSGASAHLTNSEKYMFNKGKDRSVIVVGA